MRMMKYDATPLICGVLSLAVGASWAHAQSERFLRLTDPAARANAASQPAAAGDSDTSCQLPNQDANGESGILATPCDGEIPLFCAENFRFLTPGEITQIEWWGVYLDPFDGFDDCSPIGTQNFTIRILRSDNGVPNEEDVIASFAQADGTFSFEATGEIIGDLTPEFRFTFTPDEPITVPLDDYYLEIFNTSPEGSMCFWYWTTAPPGDESSAQEDEGDGDYDAGDVGLPDNDFDVAHCLEFESAGAQQATPAAEIFLTDPSDPESGCCNYGFTIENRNTPAPGLEITEFYLAVSKGTPDAEAPACEDITNVTPPPGFDVEFCEPWADGTTVLRFSGGFLEPQDTVFGRISAGRNGDEDVTVMARVVVGGEVVEQEQTILAQGVRAWASQTDPAGACGTGNFSPLGTIGDWSVGEDSVCFIEPIPALGGTSKVALAVIFAGLGLVLVRRSRTSAPV